MGHAANTLYGVAPRMTRSVKAKRLGQKKSRVGCLRCTNFTFGDKEWGVRDVATLVAGLPGQSYGVAESPSWGPVFASGSGVTPARGTPPFLLAVLTFRVHRFNFCDKDSPGQEWLAVFCAKYFA